jgi:hypothetical protein
MSFVIKSKSRGEGDSLPFMTKRLDFEPQRRTDRPDILPVQLLQDRRFPCVIQPTARRHHDPDETRPASQRKNQREGKAKEDDVYRKRIRISFSLKRFLRMIVRRPILLVHEGEEMGVWGTSVCAFSPFADRQISFCFLDSNEPGGVAAAAGDHHALDVAVKDKRQGGVRNRMKT